MSDEPSFNGKPAGDCVPAVPSLDLAHVYMRWGTFRHAKHDLLGYELRRTAQRIKGIETRRGQYQLRPENFRRGPQADIDAPQK